MDIYLVGGAVRDSLLGLAQADRDWVVVGASVEDMLQQGFLQVGKDFPVFLHPRTREEYALARTERKSGRGHTGFTLQADPGVTLEEDLRRRDLTINAIAQDNQGRLVDPYGGERDLQQRWLRHVSPAFAEDPLRILRVARFAARFADRGFRVAGETMALMCQMVEAGELQDLPPERIWQELHKSLGEGSPGVFIEMLRQCGALRDLMPELDKLFDIAAADHPQLDLGQHTLLALQQACKLSTDSVVRYAVLLHAAGSEGPGQTDEARAQHVEAVDAISQRLRAPREHAAMARLLARYRHQGHAILSARAAEILQLLESLDAFRRPDQLQHFLLGCEADARGWPGLENSSYPQAARLRSAFEAARQLDAGALLRQHGLLDSTDDQRETGAQSPKDKARQIRELLTRHRLQAIDRALLAEGEPSQPPDRLS